MLSNKVFENKLKRLTFCSIALDPTSRKLYATCGELAYCLDAKDGKLLWKQKISPSTHCYLKIITNGLLISGNGYIQRLDLNNGLVKYSTSLDNKQGLVSMLVVKDKVYAANKGWIYEINKESGEIIWKIRLGTAIIRFGSTLLYQDNLLTSGRNSYMTIVDLSTRNIARDTKEKKLIGDSTVSMLERNSKMLIVALNSKIKAREPITHNDIWKKKLSITNIYGISISQNDKYVFAGSNGWVYCLDPETGSTIWEKQLSQKSTDFVSLLVRNDKLIAVCKGKLYVVDISKGNLDMKIELNCNHDKKAATIVDGDTPVMDINAQPILHAIEKLQD
jgi:outer membrane protein assembly factor BamB